MKLNRRRALLLPAAGLGAAMALPVESAKAAGSA